MSDYDAMRSAAKLIDEIDNRLEVASRQRQTLAELLECAERVENDLLDKRRDAKSRLDIAAKPR